MQTGWPLWHYDDYSTTLLLWVKMGCHRYLFGECCCRSDALTNIQRTGGKKQDFTTELKSGHILPTTKPAYNAKKFTNKNKRQNNCKRQWCNDSLVSVWHQPNKQWWLMHSYFTVAVMSTDRSYASLSCTNNISERPSPNSANVGAGLLSKSAPGGRHGSTRRG